MENTEIKEKKGLMARIQDYIDSPKGRILLNYLYSWGAAIVILGALFKLTHIKGANLMLFLGMGTEVLVFFISGFERPYIPDDDNCDEQDNDRVQGHGSIIINAGLGGGVLNLGNQPVQQGAVQPVQQDAGQSGQPVSPAQAVSAPTKTSGTPASGGAYGAVAPGQTAANQFEESAAACADQIARLSESLESMLSHTKRMEQSSDEMEQLTRNLISINTFYEMHLKAASQQMQNLESASGETRRMVEQIEELNRVYARMIEAMKVNSRLGAE